VARGPIGATLILVPPRVVAIAITLALGLALCLAPLSACSSSSGPASGQAPRDEPSSAADPSGPAAKGTAMTPWIPTADPAARPEAVGLWRVPAAQRERTPSPSVRSHPGTLRFLYDGQTVTLHLFSEKDWMYRSPDDLYRLASRWHGDLLQYRPPFGTWTDLARFRDGRFETTRDDPPWHFERVSSRDACETDDLPLLAGRTVHDYSIKPTDPSPK